MSLEAYFESTAAEWEAIYGRGTVYSAIYGQRLNAALDAVDALRLPPGSAVVDVGCGPGLGAVALANRGFRVTAVDSSPRMIARTLERARAAGVEVRCRLCDVRSLALRDEDFDLAFVVGVSEWLETLDQAFRELARVLLPGGALVLTGDNSWAISSLLDPLQNPLVVPFKRALGKMARRVMPWRQPIRVHPRSRGDLEAALRRAGLAPAGGTTLGYGPFTFFNVKLVSEAMGHRLHRRLADVRWLRDAGLVHVLAARKLTPPSAPG
jgi:ubiquinone/menaquinone biosynthesis C-methylase UbiE